MPNTGTTACSTCPCNHSMEAITSTVEAVASDVLNRYFDQFETSFSDEIQSEVTHRPAARQRAVCTP
ncbi:MAG: hypothetical protein LUE91_05490 [Oscillospiraceae bacterium]|nr:hypothetical protein [Oscillospiraceae bacterium]